MGNDAKHDCNKALAKAVKANVKLSPNLAQEGDLWTCACGRIYEHYCDESDGCGWQEVKAEIDALPQEGAEKKK